MRWSRCFKIKLIFIVGLFYFLQVDSVFAQAEIPNGKWQLRQIKNSDGLSNSAVSAIYKDRRGYLWFGSWDGLNQFDGHTIIRHYPDLMLQNRISNNIIWDIFEQDLGLWIVTERGINLYDYDFKKFTSWFNEDTLRLNRENGLRAFADEQGKVWLVQYGVGLYSFNKESREFDPVNIEGLNPEVLLQLTGVFKFGSRIYLMHQSNEIYEIDEQGIFIRKVSPQLQTSSSFKVDLNWFFSINEKPYAAFPDSQGGIWIVDLIEGNYKFIGNEVIESPVTALFADDNLDGIILGTDKGNILVLSFDDFEATCLLHQLPDLEEKKVKIWSVFKSGKHIWIGTDGEGVFQINTSPLAFQGIEKGALQEQKLSHKIVRTIYEDKTGNLWIGTRGNGLNKIPSDGGPTIIFNTSNGLSNDAVLSLAEDDFGYLWIGTDGSGIDVLNLATGEFRHFPDDFEASGLPQFGSVYDICIDIFNTIWLGTSGYGVISIAPDYKEDFFTLKTFSHLQGRGGANDLRGNVVFSIVEDQPNVLWIGTRMSGLHRYNSLTGEIQFFGQAVDQSNGLNNSDVLSLLKGTNNELWIGTSGGLNLLSFNGQKPNFEYYTTADGLPNHTIHSMLEDKQGNVWVSTNNGLSRLLRDQNRFVNYNRGDGLLNSEFTDGAAFKSQNADKLYFGGTNGVDWFYPDQIPLSTNNPEVLLTEFSVFNRVAEPGDELQVLEKDIDATDKIVLKHNQNFFSIAFTTINYDNPAKILFSYRLSQFNQEWVDIGEQRFANFTNVPPGIYQLQLRATNEDAIWSDKIRTLEIVIKPPFWRTTAAYIFYFLSFLLFIFLVYRYQSNRIKRRHREALDDLNRKKEQELNRHKFEFFTNLAHEFRTPLTLIFASAANLMEKAKQYPVEQSLFKSIYQNALRLQKMIDELLAFQKLDSGRDELKLQQLELIGFVGDIVEIFRVYAIEKEIDLIFEPDEQEKHVQFDPEKLERILLNLLSNAVKFTPPGGMINVGLESLQNEIHITIRDNGIGIKSKDLPLIFDRYFYQNPLPERNQTGHKSSGIGLAYTKSLVEIHKGRIEVESEPNRGSIFKVYLPILSQAKPENSINNPRSSELLEHLRESISEEFLIQQSLGFENDILPDSASESKSKYRILIVEDDVQLLMLIRKLMSEHYDVEIAGDGKQALEILNKKRIDLVVSDVMMPNMSGLELARIIKEDLITSHIPVILLTAKSANEHVIQGLETGADGYVVKPFHPRHLHLRIAKLLETREILMEGIRKNFDKQAEIEEQHLSDRDRKLLEKAHDFIAKHYQDDQLNADDLADELALSKAQLYRKIKALSGLTPHGLIKNFRLIKAREFIKAGNHSISDIVFMTGFNNRAYFYRSYRELFNETPGEMYKQK